MSVENRRLPILVAIGGFSGSGKSTAAAAIAPLYDAAVVASDPLRKALYGVSPETRLPLEAYRPEVSAVVYGRLMEDAGRLLQAGHSVVADAVFDRWQDRAAIAAVATQAGARFLGLWLQAPMKRLIERVAARVGDASDATPDVVLGQIARQREAVSDWTILSTDASADAVTTAAVRLVQAWYAAGPFNRSAS